MSAGHAALLLGVAVITIYQVRALSRPTDLMSAALAFMVGWLLCVALLASRGRGGIYSPAAAYLAVFGLFHGGLLLNYLVRGKIALPGVTLRWFFSSDAPVAATLASIGMIAFAIGSYSIRVGAPTPLRPSPSSSERRVLGMLGLGVQAIGLVIFASVVSSGGALSGYAAYLAVAERNGVLSYGMLALGVGPVLAIAAGGRARVVTWSLFTMYALLAFPLGLRGEVLFPLVAMLVVEVRRGRRMRPIWTAVGALLVMTFIGVVRQTRAGGVAALLKLPSLTSPLDAIAEMGYSLRPTVVVLGWHQRGEPFRDGDTIFAVPVRALEKLLGDSPPEYDDRLFNSEILARVGAIGGSPVAEGYHNFGTAGVIGGMALLGILVARLTRMDRTPQNDALLGAMLVILLTQVRNSFAPVPLQVVLVVSLLVGARLLTRTYAVSSRSHRVPGLSDGSAVLPHTRHAPRSPERNSGGG